MSQPSGQSSSSPSSPSNNNNPPPTSNPNHKKLFTIYEEPNQESTSQDPSKMSLKLPTGAAKLGHKKNNLSADRALNDAAEGSSANANANANATSTATASTNMNLTIPPFSGTAAVVNPTNDMFRFELRRAFSKRFNWKETDMHKFKEMSIEEVMEFLFEAPYPHPKLPLTKLIVDIHLAAIEWGNEMDRQPQDPAKVQEQWDRLRALGGQINSHNVEYINSDLRMWMINNSFVGIGQAIPDFD